MANSLAQNQIYTIINAINAEAKTGSTLQAVDTSSFVAVGETLLRSGYDNVIGAISQVLSKTIFSHRPYDAILDILYNDEIRWGNHVRKIVPLDQDAEQDNRYALTDGQSVDPWVIAKPKVKQFNFYGQEVYARHITMFKDQLDVAFNSEDEFARFVSMIYGNVRDQLEQDEENVRRMCLANFIGGIHTTSPASVINLLAEYNTATGLSLTTTTVYQPANYKAFIQWASARIMNVSDELRQRGYRWHKNLTISGTAVNIPRHTPKEYQKFIMFSPEYRRIENSALADTWHNDLVKGFDGFEAINFFQNPDHPDQVKVTPSIINNAGEFVKGNSITVSGIVGMIFDRDAMGQTRINEWSQATPLNPNGGYTNMFWHRTNRWYNDFTENAALFIIADTNQQQESNSRKAAK